MPFPSAKRLIQAAKKEAAVENEDELVAKITASRSTFYRWKKQDTGAYQTTMELLAIAGWLKTEVLAEEARAHAQAATEAVPRRELPESPGQREETG